MKTSTRTRPPPGDLKEATSKETAAEGPETASTKENLDAKTGVTKTADAKNHRKKTTSGEDTADTSKAAPRKEDHHEKDCRQGLDHQGKAAKAQDQKYCGFS